MLLSSSFQKSYPTKQHVLLDLSPSASLIYNLQGTRACQQAVAKSCEVPAGMHILSAFASVEWQTLFTHVSASAHTIAGPCFVSTTYTYYNVMVLFSSVYIYIYIYVYIYICIYLYICYLRHASSCRDIFCDFSGFRPEGS